MYDDDRYNKVMDLCNVDDCTDKEAMDRLLKAESMAGHIMEYAMIAEALLGKFDRQGVRDAIQCLIIAEWQYECECYVEAMAVAEAWFDVAKFDKTCFPRAVKRMMEAGEICGDVDGFCLLAKTWKDYSAPYFPDRSLACLKNAERYYLHYMKKRSRDQEEDECRRQSAYANRMMIMRAYVECFGPEKGGKLAQEFLDRSGKVS